MLTKLHIKVFLALLTLYCSFFAFAPTTYAAALAGNIGTLSVSESNIGITCVGDSGSLYHYYLNISLPIGLNPSLLQFGILSQSRSILDYDFISYAGNSLTVDFFYMSSGSLRNFNISCVDSAVDLTQCEIISYGFVLASEADVAGSPMFIYDKVLALRQWNNITHYLSSISSNYAIQTSTMEVKDTDSHYSLDSRYGSVVTGVSQNQYTGVVPTYGQAVTSVGLSSDTDSSTGLGPTVNTYNPLSSATLTGGLSSTLGMDINNDEWGQFLDRVSVISSLTVSTVSNNFHPGFFYMTRRTSMTITPNSGYLYTNGFSPTYITFMMDIDSRPGSVSLSGCDLDTWSFNNGRLVIEAHRENQSTDSTIDLSNISITLSNIEQDRPFICLSQFVVSSFDSPQAIANMDSTRNNNFLVRGLNNIQSSFNNLLSGLTTGYNSDTSEELSSFDTAAAQLDTTVTQYVTAEESLTNSVSTHVTSFNPSMSTTPVEIISAFGLVGTVANDMFNRSGAFQYVITFTLTLGCVLFVLGLRRR